MGQSRWALVAVEGRYAGQRFPITERGLCFGREAENDIVLEDENVSRRHAVVRLSQSTPVVEDLKSRNGTFVNNKKISRQELNDGDRIALGSHLFKVVPQEAIDDLLLDDPTALAHGQEVDPERTIVKPATLAPRVAAPTMVGVDTNLMRARAEAMNLAQPSADGGWGATGTGGEGGWPARSGTAGEAGWPPPAGPGGVPGSGMTELGGPLGGAAYGGVMGAPADAMGGMYPPPAQPSESRAASGSKRGLYGVLAAVLVVAVGGIGVVSMRGAGNSGSSEGSSPPAPVAPVSAPAPGPGTSSLFAAPAPGAAGTATARKPAGISPEEAALPPQEKLTRSKEHLDQGESFLESGKLKEARDEFERALALDPGCKVCLIRVSKVESEIKKTLEKYRSDALRSFQSMEYDKARRYWEMVLELESDPAARQVAIENIQKARAQLLQQSYR